MDHILQQLLGQSVELWDKNQNPREAVPDKAIIGTMKQITLDSYLQANSIKKERKKPVQTDESFEIWWRAYPLANFTYRGMQFTSGRTLRCRKDECYRLYSRALTENDITAEQMLMALQKQVKVMKEESYESGQNRLQYMSTSDVYLRAGKYQDWLGTGDESEEEETYNSGNCA